MGLEILLDTNAVLYHLRDNLDPPLPSASFSVSIVTKIELLSFPNLSADEESRIREMLRNEVVVQELTDTIAEQAIVLRRSHRVKLPDAIIAATAAVTGRELMTNDLSLTKLPGVKSRSVYLRDAPP